jgi:hypothetical protein
MHENCVPDARAEHHLSAPPATVEFPLAINGQCVLMAFRAERLRPSELVDVLGQQVPTRLPAGFGLLAGWASSSAGGSNGAIWVDARCRQVTLEVWPDAAVGESPMPTGRWLLLEHDTCKAGMACLDYPHTLTAQWSICRSSACRNMTRH